MLTIGLLNTKILQYSHQNFPYAGPFSSLDDIFGFFLFSFSLRFLLTSGGVMKNFQLQVLKENIIYRPEF
jgi:hypothetical protein